MRPKAAFLTLALASSAALLLVAAHADEASGNSAGVFLKDESGRTAGPSIELRNMKTEIDARKSREAYGLPLAARLSALEVAVGIRAEQLNAWRGYTSALQALLAPEPSKDPNADPRGDEDRSGQEKDPFDREAKLADRITARAIAAQKLKDAIAALRTTLAPNQLHQLSAPDVGEWIRIPRDAFDKIEDKSASRTDRPGQ